MPEPRAPAGPAVVVEGDAQGVIGNNYGSVTLNIGGKERTIPFLAPPRPPYSLVGRDALVARVKERLFAGQNRDAAGLTILPGAGKSALAAHLAHDDEVLEHFPDGVLWAGLGRHPDLLALLGNWAAALGVPADELAGQETVVQRQNAIRTRIADRRMLLVVDDAWDSSAARTFVLDCRNCAHLVTTRVRAVARDFAAEGVSELDELGEEDCVALLREVAPRAVEENEAAVRDLVREVGGLPLAIVLIGRRLARESEAGDPDRLAGAVTALQSRIERLKLQLPVTGLDRSPSLGEDASPTLLEIIRVSEEALDDDAKHALLVLSTFRPKPGRFTKEAAREVGDVAPASIYELFDLGLVESAGDGTYTVQRTIADFARAQLDDAEAAELHRKAASFYAEQLCSFDADAGGATSYERRCRFEDPAWQAAKGEWQYHRMLMADRDAARLDLARTYFEEFWWWGCYTDYPFCRQLLDGTGLVGAEEDEEWLTLLRRFHHAYPTWHEHRGEGDWPAVANALGEIRSALDLEGDADALDEGRRHVRALTDLFLAHAHRYQDVEDTEADRLYDEAFRLLEGSSADAWSLGWILYEQAEIDVERGHADEGLGKVAKSLPRALAERDYELIANGHALRSDVLWGRGDLDGSLRERTISLFNAYRFQRMPLPPDFYTRAYWTEAVESALEWLADVGSLRGPAEAMKAAVSLHDAWAPELWAAWAGAGGAAAPADLVQLLAEGPSVQLGEALLPEPPPDGVEEARLVQLAALLDGMSGRFAS